MLFYRGQDFCIERAGMAICDLFHLFQELSGKPDRESFCYLFFLHTAILHLLWLYAKRIESPCSTLKQGTPIHLQFESARLSGPFYVREQ